MRKVGKCCCYRFICENETKIELFPSCHRDIRTFFIISLINFQDFDFALLIIFSRPIVVAFVYLVFTLHFTRCLISSRFLRHSDRLIWNEMQVIFRRFLFTRNGLTCKGVPTLQPQPIRKVDWRSGHSVTCSNWRFAQRQSKQNFVEVTHRILSLLLLYVVLAPFLEGLIYGIPANMRATSQLLQSEQPWENAK